MEKNEVNLGHWLELLLQNWTKPEMLTSLTGAPEHKTLNFKVQNIFQSIICRSMFSLSFTEVQTEENKVDQGYDSAI